MKESKTLSSVFSLLFPLLSLLGFALAFAVVFDTFDLTLTAAAFNLLLALPLFALCLMLVRRFHAAAALAAGSSFLLYYLDQFVFSARLTHIRLSDLKLLRQAARVANRYSLVWSWEITRRLLIAVAICALLFLILCYYKLEYKKRMVFFCGLGLLALSAALLLSGVIPSGGESFDFNSETESRGLLYAWYCQHREGDLQEPEGYSREEAQRILGRYGGAPGDEAVNVIVIMNESLADYSLIGTPRFEDPLPFIHSLDQNCFEGKLVVSVFGGGTANTEYEFLTGNSTAFLPEGSTPYLQYVDGKEENLASELKSLGYDTTAIHPYYSEEWNRSQVYRFFDFDRFVSGEDFGSALELKGKKSTEVRAENLISFGEGPLYVRGLISDRTSYERVLEETGERAFIFNVTMQNHGGYDYSGEDFAAEEYVTEAEREEWSGSPTLNGMLYSTHSSSIEEELGKVNQYLTCADLSDQAFAYLLGELEKSERKTVVLMFGDHQPGLLISEHYVDAEEGVDLDYTVPYLLWANFDMEFDAPELTSPNYLSAILKKNADLPLTPWDQFRLDMMEHYPVMTANCILDAEGVPVQKDQLREYAIVQYMRMFD